MQNIANEERISLASIAAKWAEEGKYSQSQISYYLLEYILCNGFQFLIPTEILAAFDNDTLIKDGKKYYESGISHSLQINYQLSAISHVNDVLLSVLQ